MHSRNTGRFLFRLFSRRQRWATTPGEPVHCPEHLPSACLACFAGAWFVRSATTASTSCGRPPGTSVPAPARNIKIRGRPISVPSAIPTDGTATSHNRDIVRHGRVIARLHWSAYPSQATSFSRHHKPSDRRTTYVPFPNGSCRPFGGQSPRPAFAIRTNSSCFSTSTNPSSSPIARTSASKVTKRRLWRTFDIVHAGTRTAERGGSGGYATTGTTATRTETKVHARGRCATCGLERTEEPYLEANCGFFPRKKLRYAASAILHQAQSEDYGVE